MTEEIELVENVPKDAFPVEGIIVEPSSKRKVKKAKEYPPESPDSISRKINLLSLRIGILRSRIKGDQKELKDVQKRLKQLNKMAIEFDKL